MFLRDALGQGIGSGLDLRPQFPALDLTGVSSLARLLPAISDTSVVVPDEKANVSAQDHVVFTTSLHESAACNSKSRFISSTATPTRELRAIS